MRTLIVLVFLLNISLQAATQPVTVAVFDFESKDETTKTLGQKLSTLLAAQLSANPYIITVERAELDKALGEQELGLSATVTPDTAARVGNLIGAKVLVTGRVFNAGSEILAVAKIIGTETGRVYGETSKMKQDGEISIFSEDLAKKIAATVIAKADTLVAKSKPREERIKKLVTAGKAAKPIAISVNIPEQHFGTRVADPAAQTQLLSILQQAGFEIVDAKSDKEPDVEISGQAFSAFGLRKGNLFACKARLEIKMQQRSGGKILFAGSRTSVAADITEQTAAKTALENVVLDIAPALFTKLNK